MMIDLIQVFKSLKSLVALAYELLPGHFSGYICHILGNTPVHFGQHSASDFLHEMQKIKNEFL